MKCSDLKELLSSWIDGEASPSEARQVEEHLETCAGCRTLERKMRAVGIGVARTEGSVPPGFREKLFARMEAEELLPRRRSLFAYSLRWAAVPLAAAAAAILFLLVSPEKVKDGISPQGQLPTMARPGQPTETVPQTAPPSPEVSPQAAKRVLPRGVAEGERGETATVARPGGELTEEERDIIANLDILEESADIDGDGDIDELEIMPARRSRG
jgi:hypothetical protein